MKKDRHENPEYFLRNMRENWTEDSPIHDKECLAITDTLISGLSTSCYEDWKDVRNRYDRTYEGKGTAFCVLIGFVHDHLDIIHANKAMQTDHPADDR